MLTGFGFDFLVFQTPLTLDYLPEEGMALFGDTEEDFAAVKVKNSIHGSKNPNARFTKTFTKEDVEASPIVADPLRLLEICTTSDGGAALVVSSLKYAKQKRNY